MGSIGGMAGNLAYLFVNPAESSGWGIKKPRLERRGVTKTNCL